MGFFSSEQIKADKKSLITGCKACPLYSDSEPLDGYEGNKRLLVVLDYPTRGQDRSGDIVVGSTMELLVQSLNNIGADIDDFGFTFAVKCRPIKGAPKAHQANSCAYELEQDIVDFDPHIIIPMGEMALRATLSHAMHHGAGIDKWRGWQIPDRKWKAWVCPTFHPRFLLETVDTKYKKNRIERFPVYRKIWERDLQEAFSRLEVPLPEYKDEKECITILTNPDKINEVLDQLYRSANLIAFDYETTGLRPQAPGMEIVSCAIADSPDRAWSFPMSPEIEKGLRKLLKKRQIRKIAANIGFEERWTRVHLGIEVQGWFHDVNTWGHIFDSRKGVSNVKFMTYAYTGCADYNSHVESYLKGREDHANSLNRIKELHQKDLLTYNAIDALVEYRIAEKQLEMVDHV